MKTRLKKLDGYDEAVIGIALTWNKGEGESAVVYDGNKIITILRKRDGMSFDEAVEFIDYNIVDTYYGENTLLIMWQLRDDWDEEHDI